MRACSHLVDVRKKEGKKIQQETNNQSRKERIALALAHMRYVKVIAGSVVDDFKELHNNENIKAYHHVESELHKELQHLVPTDVRMRLLATVKKSLDIYDGIRTEKQEQAVLRNDVKLHPADQVGVDALLGRLQRNRFTSTQCTLPLPLCA